MRTPTRVAEGISALLLLMLGVFNPHAATTIYLLVGVEVVAAVFVAITFPRKGSAFVAIALVIGVLLTLNSGLGGSGGGEGLHSPIMGFSALPLLVLVISQVTAGIGAITALRRGDDLDPHPTPASREKAPRS